MRKWGSLFSGLILLGMDRVHAQEIKYTWDIPKYMHASQREKVSVTCAVYTRFVLFTMVDPEQQGATFQVRKRELKPPRPEECEIATGEKLIEFAGGSPQGVIGSTLVLVAPGSLGDGSVLVLIDALTGDTRMSREYDVSQNVILKKVGKRVQITYTAFLEEPRERCDLMPGEPNICQWI